MQQSIKVGIYDWCKFSNTDGFYPPDIPEEWKLTYFSNEFDSACLSLGSLTSSIDLLGEWCEGLRDSFELSFSVNHIDQIPALAELLEHTQLLLRYLIIEPSNCDNLLHNESLQSVLFAAGIKSNEQIISSADLWRPEIQDKAHSAVALFPVTSSLRQYRDWIDQWLQSESLQSSGQDLTLWLPGSTTEYQLLSECRTLVEMMGY